MCRYVDLEAGSQVPLVTGHPALIASLALPQAVPLPVELPQPQGTAPGHGVVPSQVSNMQMMASTAADGVLRVWQLPPNQSDWHQVGIFIQNSAQSGTSHLAPVQCPAGVHHVLHEAMASPPEDWHSSGLCGRHSLQPQRLHAPQMTVRIAKPDVVRTEGCFECNTIVP